MNRVVAVNKRANKEKYHCDGRRLDGVLGKTSLISFFFWTRRRLKAAAWVTEVARQHVRQSADAPVIPQSRPSAVQEPEEFRKCEKLAVQK